MEELTGAQLIAKERQEQIEKHGWSLDRDQYYDDEELVQAALYCINSGRYGWPDNWDQYFRNKIDNKTRKDRLIVAGAFVAAEIDRLLSLEKEK